jgi:hypothetical protein
MNEKRIYKNDIREMSCEDGYYRLVQDRVQWQEFVNKEVKSMSYNNRGLFWLAE